MYPNTLTQLKVEIEAENKVNQAVLDHAPVLFENAMSLVGKPIFKVDGSLRKDAEVVLDIPQFDGRDLMTFLNRSKYFLSITFKANTWARNPEPGSSDNSARAEVSVYLGCVSDGALVDSAEFDAGDYKADYTVEGVIAAREACVVAKKAYEAAKTACGPFGEGR